ncbi:uncharacterized protein LOC143236499 [Tachypleus tridentatus]|uniref:uncharacterized protein LOC143236499 n=1 Tax=Tachypleus tridentatus TaxID=6853 RepID=UPI003FD53272
MLAGQPFNILPWITPILFCLVLVVLLVLCTCLEKSENVSYGTTGRLSFLSSPSAQHIEDIGANGHMTIPSADGAIQVSLDTKSRTKDRALPDVPLVTIIRSPASETNQDLGSDNCSECNETVFKKMVNPVRPKNHRRNKATTPTPPGMNGLTVSVSTISNSRPHSAPLTPASFDTISLDFLQNPSLVQAVNRSTELYSMVSKIPPVHHSLITGKEKCGDKDTNGLYNDPEVSIKGLMEPALPTFSFCKPTSFSKQLHRDTVDSDNFLTSQADDLLLPLDVEQRIRNTSTASQAVAGRIPSAEIPYMTPLLQHTLLATNAEDRMEVASEIRDTPYNMISVREPLAKVREEMLRMQQRRVGNSVSASQFSEGHYTVVPDDEEVYEEIDRDSSQISEKFSSLYVSIEPERYELPPAPPTVESLKSVAKAHSRQASFASVTSFESNEMIGTSEDSVCLPFTDVTSLYSVVDKSNKQRQTIHIAEGVSFYPRSKNEPQNIEEMYAKVNKKRLGSSTSTSGVEATGRYSTDDVFGPPVPPRSPTFAMDISPDLPSTVHCHAGNVFVFRASTDGSFPTTSPGTQSIDLLTKDDDNEDSDPGYEPIKHHVNTANGQSYNPLKRHNYVSDVIRHKCIKCKNYTVNEPDYEQVRSEKDTSNDPGYEQVRDLGYENIAQKSVGDFTVNGFLREDIVMEKHHGYESVKNLQRNDSDVTDSHYEKVRPQGFDGNKDPNYEPVTLIQSHQSELDYETVRGVTWTERDEADPGYECLKGPRLHPTSSCEPPYEIVPGADNGISGPRYENIHHQDLEKGENTSYHVEEFFHKLVDPSSQVEVLNFSSPDEIVKYTYKNTPNQSDNSENYYETIPSKREQKSYKLLMPSQLTKYVANKDKINKNEQENNLKMNSTGTKIKRTNLEEDNTQVNETSDSVETQTKDRGMQMSIVEDSSPWRIGPVEA